MEKEKIYKNLAENIGLENFKIKIGRASCRERV